MAKKSDKKQKGKKGSGKNRELTFTQKVKRFFGNLKNELKLVVWPDRKEVKQTTAVVLLVVAATVVLVFIIDSLMVGILKLTGFESAPSNSQLNPPAQTRRIETSAEEEAFIFEAPADVQEI